MINLEEGLSAYDARQGKGGHEHDQQPDEHFVFRNLTPNISNKEGGNCMPKQQVSKRKWKHRPFQATIAEETISFGIG